MNLAPSSFVSLNFAVFAGIAMATLVANPNDNVWTVTLAVLGAMANALAWWKFSNAETASNKDNEPKEIAERERLMEDLGEEAERRRERDRIERN
tara:strand:- start:420 stop:704 length:285 start_codon:yes stop_codon:yes gene_type:complete